MYNNKNMFKSEIMCSSWLPLTLLAYKKLSIMETEFGSQQWEASALSTALLGHPLSIIEFQRWEASALWTAPLGHPLSMIELYELIWRWADLGVSIINLWLCSTSTSTYRALGTRDDLLKAWIESYTRDRFFVGDSDVSMLSRSTKKTELVSLICPIQRYFLQNVQT